MSFWRNLLTAFLLLVSQVVNGKNTNYPFTRYGLEDGLPHTIVKKIFQDQSGYLWFGTGDGLARFDGREFRVFRPNGLQSSRLVVNDILGDSSNQLWLGTEIGLFSFDPYRQTFEYILNAAGEHPGRSNQVQSLCFIDSKRLIVCTTDGLFLYTIDKKEFTQLLSPAINARACYMQGQYLWVSTGLHGIYRIRIEKDITRWKIENFPRNDKGLDDVSAFFEDKHGKLWVGGRKILQFNEATKSFQPEKRLDQEALPPEEMTVSSIYADWQGRVWIGINHHGIVIYDPEKQTIEQITRVVLNGQAISLNRVNCLLLDHSGVLWVGTDKSGLYKFDPEYKRFHNLCPLPLAPDLSEDNSIYSIWTGFPSRKIFMGSQGGSLHEFDRVTGKTTTLFSPGDPRLTGIHAFRYAGALWGDQHGYLWIGSWAYGLVRYGPNHDIQTYLPNQEKEGQIQSWSHRSILTDSRGYMWIVSADPGLHRYDPRTNRFQSFLGKPGQKGLYHGDYVWTVHEDKLGNIWVGTESSGLWLGRRHDDMPDSLSFHLLSLPGRGKSLNQSSIRGIREDYRGYTWVGTAGNGLFCLSPEMEVAHHLTTSDGLLNNTVYGIMDDARGNLWVMSEKGISRLDPSTLRFKNYTSGDGLAADEYNPNAWFQSEQGEIFLGTVKGISYFHPDSIKDNPYPAKVAITGLYINGKPVSQGSSGKRRHLDKPLHNGDTLVLPFRYKDLSLGLISLHYSNPLKNKISYQIEGTGNAWTVLEGANPVIDLQFRKEGVYPVKIKASNNDELWTHDEYRVTFVVLAPVYKKAEFILVLVSLLVILGLFTWKRASSVAQQEVQPIAHEKKLNHNSDESLENNEFLGKILELLENTEDLSSLRITDLASRLGMSRSQLFRKIKNISGQSPQDYLKSIRLFKAMELIKEGRYNISEIAYKVGFNDPKYFTRCFRQQFGKNPSTFIQKM